MSDETERPQDAEQVESLPEPAAEQQVSAEDAQDVKGGIIIDVRKSSTARTDTRLDAGGIVGPEY